jgi:hypothetical protein
MHLGNIEGQPERKEEELNVFCEENEPTLIVKILLMYV